MTLATVPREKVGRARRREERSSWCEEIAERYAEWEILGEPELRADEPVKMWNPTTLPQMVGASDASIGRPQRESNLRPRP